MYNIDVYQSNIGIFVKRDYYGSFTQINGIDIDTFSLNQGFYFLEGIHQISSISKAVLNASKITGYELNTPSLASDSIPLHITPEQASLEFDDYNDITQWGSEFRHIESLYQPIYSKPENNTVDVEFTLNVLRTITIENYNAPQQMQIATIAHNKPVPVSTCNIVQYDDIQRLLTPEFLLHDRPCTISADTMYGIIRAHVKQNINPMAAQITNDYDFCFKVARRIKTKVTVHTTEKKKANGRSYSTPVFHRTTTDSKLVPLFDMAPKKYQEYTVLSGWSADSLAEMNEQIGVYLSALMEEINKTSAECPHCAGLGIIPCTLPTRKE